MRASKIAIAVAVGALALPGAFFALRRVHAAVRSPADAASVAKVLSSPRTGGSTPTLYFVKDPQVAPPFLVRNLAGGVLSTVALRGKVVFLNFWATWCGPCREEIPELIALQSRYKDKLVIIGASEDEAPPEQVAQFAKRAGINYPIIMSSAALEQEYGGVVALPTSFVIDEQGRVVQKHVGLDPNSFQNFDLEIRALLGMPVDAQIKTFEDTGQVFLKNASKASELPGVSFGGLTPQQRKAALKQINARTCTCGCEMTLAQCRITDPPCATSRELANKIVSEISHAGPAKTATPAKAATASRR
jgi:thiol-disulfide isomerase/thioredoxin